MARARTNHTISRIVYLLILTIVIFIDITNCKPYQILKHKDGYIAVYIRHGNEPLENIDPVLAEAFHENNFKKGVLPIEHQYIDTTEKSIINHEESREIIPSNIQKI